MMNSFLSSGGARLIDWIYPIGSVITSINSKYDPNKFFKTQTWVRFAAGKTLVGYNSAETAGGAKTHTLTTTQIPSHSHSAVNGDSTIHFTELDIVDGKSGKISVGSATSN